jgi:hypothetical protein
MKIKNHKHKTIHLHIEQLLRHKASLALVTFLMLTAVASFDGRLRGLMQEAYAQGWSWVGTYLHHEHPAHGHSSFAMARIPTISGPGPV